jgi:phosphoadenosine phosphosulfate reductase
MGMGRRPLVDRYTCCYANLMLPMHERMLADGVTLAIRGTKRADLPRLPAVSGDVSLGYELWLPLENWSHAEVFEYLRSVDAPICRVYEHQVNAPECSTCTAWWSEGRAAYLSRFHPDRFDKYQARLALVAAEVAPHWQLLTKEMSDGRF